MFPNYKTKNILGIKFKVKDDWKDLGRYGDNSSYDMQYHSFCGAAIRIGRNKDGTVFKYCPRCLIKLNVKVKD